jgi:hypothetical protein
MLKTEIRFELTPAFSGVSERRKEVCLEPTDLVGGRQQVSMELPRIDLRPVGIREQHPTIVSSSVQPSVTRGWLTSGISRGARIHCAVGCMPC